MSAAATGASSSVEGGGSSPRIISLEQELADATQDLLHLGSSSLPAKNGKTRLSAVGQGALPAPSPLRLDGTGTFDIVALQGPSSGLSVSEALHIDANARLTPVEEARVKHGSTASASRPPLSAPTVSNGRFPASQLHRTTAPVDERDIAGERTDRPKSATSSRIEALENEFSDRFAASRPASAAAKRDEDARRKKQMHALQARLENASPRYSSRVYAEGVNEERGVLRDTPPPSIGQQGDFRASGSRAPAFFLQSFPDALASTSEAREPVETTLPSTSHGQGNASDEIQRLGSLTAPRSSEHDDTLQELDPTAAIDDSVAPPDHVSSHASSPVTKQRSLRRPRSVGRRRSSGSQSLVTLSSSRGSAAGSLARERIDADALGASTAPFARDVSIRSFSIVGARARGYVAYDVHVTLRTGTTLSLLRRFSAFVALRRALMRECGDGQAQGPGMLRQKPSQWLQSSKQARPSPQRPASSQAILPQLPTRRAGLLHKYAAHHLESRRLALQRWLQVVMLDGVYGTSRSLRQWVVGPDEEADEAASHGSARDDDD